MQHKLTIRSKYLMKTQQLCSFIQFIPLSPIIESHNSVGNIILCYTNRVAILNGKNGEDARNKDIYQTQMRGYCVSDCSYVQVVVWYGFINKLAMLRGFPSVDVVKLQTITAGSTEWDNQLYT